MMMNIRDIINDLTDGDLPPFLSLETTPLLIQSYLECLISAIMFSHASDDFVSEITLLRIGLGLLNYPNFDKGFRNNIKFVYRLFSILLMKAYIEPRAANHPVQK